MDLISVTNVNKVYEHDSRTVEVLSDFNMHVRSGEIVAVLGPSGCGKTTLLRIVAGLVPPTSGEVRIGDKKPSEYSLGGTISFVFQKPLLFPWRTVEQNV